MKRLAIGAMASMMASTSVAAIFTVGADGTYSTIQSAINAATLAGGTNQIHVETGSYTENLTLAISAGALDITGGWDSSFAHAGIDPTATDIFGGSTDRVFTVTATGGEMTISGFTLLGGSSPANENGGGMFATVGGTALVQVRNSHFILNTAQSTVGNSYGGGLAATVQNTGTLLIDNVDIDDNAASTTTGIAGGGGVFIQALDTSDTVISNSSVQDNAVTTNSTGHLQGAGLVASLSADARFTLNRVDFLSNTLNPHSMGSATFSGAFISVGCTGACEADIVASRFDQNGGVPTEQLTVGVGGSGTPKVLLADLLVVRGSGGVSLDVNSGVGNAVSLTVADNESIGMSISNEPGATATLANSIVYDNASNILQSGTPALTDVMIGIDPRFVDDANGDYHIAYDSSARDGGTKTPPGGLGLFDLDGNTRLVGAAPDVGAFEIQDSIFANGFEVKLFN